MSKIAIVLAERALRQRIRSAMRHWSNRLAAESEIPVLLVAMGLDGKAVLYPLTERAPFPHGDLVQLVAVVLEELRARRYDDRTSGPALKE